MVLCFLKSVHSLFILKTHFANQWNVVWRANQLLRKYFLSYMHTCFWFLCYDNKQVTTANAEADSETLAQKWVQ